ncbi:E3 ubiquitin-protein ligase MPSR1-like [Euphorbia lathyris]|uniref:E3 ubiquitin-protein ligase MPSR1-like n=1 Tax=Euphorbia lathyris TaxID=212925 RepID=UPI003313C0DA
MASDTEEAELSSAFEMLFRNGDLSPFLPFLLGFTSSSSLTDNTNQDEDEETRTRNRNRNERIILINPFTQGMVVIEGADTLDALVREFATKDGQPPASKASIEAMPSVEITQIGDQDSECTICLEEWEPGRLVKEMPCKHRFHGACIDKWLGIHGSCPVCRYKMPVDKEEPIDKRDEDDEQGRRRIQRQVWVSLSFNRDRTTQTPSADQQMEN